MVKQRLTGAGGIKFDRVVVRPRCGVSDDRRQQLEASSSGSADDKRVIRDTELQLDAKYLKLEEDRIFHTCHLLPRGVFTGSG